jgi:Domain of unknown function (DUF397)
VDTMGTITDLSRATWRKSSFSGGNGSECVEVMSAPIWRKSSHSTANGECVEVGDAGYAVAVRDSKDPDGPSLLVSPGAWSSFTSQIKSGRLV